MDSTGRTRIASTPLRFHGAERPIRPDVRARRRLESSSKSIGAVRAVGALLRAARSSGSGGGSGRGKGVRTGAGFPQWMYAQRVVVKARVVRNRGAGGRQTMRAHMNYLEREGVDEEGGAGRPFNASEFLSPEASEAFVSRAADDRHHFRFIVSPEHGAALDLTEYTRDLMSQAQRDLGTPLDWVAVAHHNTDNPHVHIIVRGQDERGADLVISREYISRTFRERGQEIATRELGLRLDPEIERQRAQELKADRLTALDSLLEREMGGEGLIDVRPAAARLPGSPGERLRLEKISRLHHLESLGLAFEGEVGRWKLQPEALTKLRELGADERLSTSFFRFVDRSYRFSSIKLYEKARPDAAQIEGELVARGKLEEFDEQDTIFVASNRGSTAGRVYRLTLSERSEDATQPLRVGQQVRLSVHRRADVSAADYNIMTFAASDGGEYSIERHREALENQARRGRLAVDEIDERLERHVRRLEGHERRGFVTRVAPGRWRIPADLEASLEAYGLKLGDRRLTPQVVALSHLTLDEQLRARGATWLDGQLASGAHLHRGGDGWSAPERLRTAMRQRVEFLNHLGVDVVRRALSGEQLEGLYRLEVQEAAERLRRQGLGSFIGQEELPRQEVSDGRVRRSFEGQIYTKTPLISGPHVVLIAGDGFTILPVSASARLSEGSQVAAVITPPHQLDPKRPKSAQNAVQYTDLQRYREIEKGRELGD